MPIGVSFVIVLSIFLLFKLGESVCRKLNISRFMLLGFCIAYIIAFFSPALVLSETFGINIPVVSVSLVFILFMLIKTEASKFAARTISAGLVTAAVLLCITYIVPPIPQGYINQPYILYGITGGLLAFFLAKNTASAAVAASMGLLLLDMSISFLASGSRMLYVWGSASAYNGLVLAVFVGCAPSVIFAYFKNKKVPEARVPLRTRPNYNFEISNEMQFHITTVREAKKKDAEIK